MLSPVFQVLKRSKNKLTANEFDGKVYGGSTRSNFFVEKKLSKGELSGQRAWRSRIQSRNC